MNVQSGEQSHCSTAHLLLCETPSCERDRTLAAALAKVRGYSCPGCGCSPVCKPNCCFIIALISLAQIPLSRFGKEIPNLREGGSSHCENGSPQMQL